MKNNSFLNWTVVLLIIVAGVYLTYLNIHEIRLEVQSKLETVTYFFIAIAGVSSGIILLPKLAKYVEEGSRVNLLSELKNVSAALENKSKDQIKNLIKDVLTEERTKEEFVLNNLEEINFPELSENEEKIDLIEQHTVELQHNISQQINKISRGGTINLLIGLTLTIIAITMLILTVYADEAPAYLFDETTNSGMRFFIHMIPRLSIVLFVELFSFFFLNLYKRNVEEIKYFNNERTNIESKVLALKMAVVFGDKEPINKTIESLYKTDRNSTIKKSDTTVEIEKLKLEQNGMDGMLNKFLALNKLFNKTEAE